MRVEGGEDGRAKQEGEEVESGRAFARGGGIICDDRRTRLDLALAAEGGEDVEEAAMVFCVIWGGSSSKYAVDSGGGGSVGLCATSIM